MEFTAVVLRLPAVLDANAENCAVHGAAVYAQEEHVIMSRQGLKYEIYGQRPPQQHHIQHTDTVSDKYL